MSVPALQISTLLYCFDERDRVLLLNRSLPPNRGLWSPPGGKLHAAEGESPSQCAAREAREELDLNGDPSSFRLVGMVHERGYEQKDQHWLMFLFEYLHPLRHLPPAHREGRFEWFSKEEVPALDIPETDRAFIWPQFCRHRNGFFMAECICNSHGTFEWQLTRSVASEHEPKNTHD